MNESDLNELKYLVFESSSMIFLGVGIAIRAFYVKLFPFVEIAVKQPYKEDTQRGRRSLMMSYWGI